MMIKDEEELIKRKLDEENSKKVRVALFGQPGAGKSSLINKMIGKKVAETGVETDKTTSAASYEANGLDFWELPGYGTVKFPKETYFSDFKIDSFDLFLCVTSGKLHAADTEFFRDLSAKGKVCLFVVNKHDELWEEGVPIEELERRKTDDLFKHLGGSARVLFTSCRLNTGLNELVQCIHANLDDAKKERWARGAKAYSADFLEKKTSACERYVVLAAGASALNGINPILGLDIAVDLGVLLKLFGEIRENFGLDDRMLASLKNSSVSVVVPIAKRVVDLAASQGLMALLKSFAGRETVKTVSKYVPLVGQAVAASIGFGITYAAGHSYLTDCHTLAKEILEHNLKA